MAGEKETNTQTSLPITSDEGVTSTFELGPDGQPVIAQHTGEGGETTSLSAEDLAALEGLDKEGGETATEGEQEDTLEAGTDGSDPQQEGNETTSEAADLPDFEELTPEIEAQYVEKYTSTDEAGNPVLNLAAFNAEADKVRTKEDGTEYYDLNPGTRKYLKTLGISDAIIDQHLAGYTAQKQVIADTFHSQFGSDAKDGKANYDKMIAWAREGGFTPEQKARYNAAMQAGGEAAQDQIELLKTRYISKNPTALGEATPEQKRAQLGLRKDARSASPQRSATSGKTSQAPAGYANAEEHRVAQTEAMRMTGRERTAALEEVHKKLQASTFWRK
jgi:hypothetical protein